MTGGYFLRALAIFAIFAATSALAHSACEDDLLTSLKHAGYDSAVYLEALNSQSTMKIFTTTDGTIGPVVGDDVRAIPKSLRLKLPALTALQTPWDSLSFDEKSNLIGAAYRYSHGANSTDLVIRGLRLRTDLPHLAMKSDIQFAAAPALADRAFAIQIRIQSRLSAGQTYLGAMDVAHQLGLENFKANVHLIGAYPESFSDSASLTLKHRGAVLAYEHLADAARILHYWSLIDLYLDGFLIEQLRPALDELHPQDFIHVAKSLLPTKASIFPQLDPQSTAVELRTREVYGRVAMGLEVPDLPSVLSLETAGQVLDRIQEKWTSGAYLLDPSVIDSLIGDGGLSARISKYDKILPRLTYRAEWIAPYLNSISRAQLSVVSSAISANSFSRILINNWRDTLLFDWTEEEQSKLPTLQLQAIQSLERGVTPEEAVRDFFRKSGLQRKLSALFE